MDNHRKTQGKQGGKVERQQPPKERCVFHRFYRFYPTFSIIFPIKITPFLKKTFKILKFPQTVEYDCIFLQYFKKKFLNTCILTSQKQSKKGVDKYWKKQSKMCKTKNPNFIQKKFPHFPQPIINNMYLLNLY